MKYGVLEQHDSRPSGAIRGTVGTDRTEYGTGGPPATENVHT